MRVLVITEEDEFYLPIAIDYLLENSRESILEVVCARNPLTPNKLKAARKFYGAFGLYPVLSHGFRLAEAKFLDIFCRLKFSGRYYSVKNVCRKYNVPYSHCDNINSPHFLDHCRDLNVELIASVSPTQIFKEDLINLPKYGCINIHTAKLPKYRGLYPTYWAMACGEKTIGISIHYIEEGIDTGRIILQDEVEIPSETTLHRMLTTTKLKGAELLVESIGKIGSNTAEPFYAEGKGTYFSFPTFESYQKFKRLCYKLW